MLCWWTIASWQDYCEAGIELKITLYILVNLIKHCNCNHELLAGSRMYSSNYTIASLLDVSSKDRTVHVYTVHHVAYTVCSMWPLANHGAPPCASTALQPRNL